MCCATVLRRRILGAALFVFFFRLAEILSIISRVSPTVVVNYIRVLPTVFVNYINYINYITLLSQFYIEPLKSEYLNGDITKKRKQIFLLPFSVRAKGLEPPRREALDPQSSAATNYATPAGPGLGLQR